MKKNYMFIMVALVALVLMVLPVSAVAVGTSVNHGATVFIGEQGLDITPAMEGYTTLGYWSSGSVISTTSPVSTIPVSGRLTSFSVTQSEFAGYTGSWYQVDSAGHAQNVAFIVADPRLSVSIRNGGDLSSSLDGKTVASGTPVTFKLDTNIVLSNNRKDMGSPIAPSVIKAPWSNFTVSGGSATSVRFTDISNNTPTSWDWTINGVHYAEPNPVVILGSSGTTPYSVSLKTTNLANPSGPSERFGTVIVTSTSAIVTYGSLIAPDPVTLNFGGSTGGLSDINSVTDGYINIIVKSDSGSTYSSLVASNGTSMSLKNQYISIIPYYWNGGSWKTNATSGGQRVYQNGNYTVSAECVLNGMKDNYNVVGKTVSETQNVRLGSDSISITANKESVVRGKPFSVTIIGQPNVAYTLALKNVLTTATDAPVITGYQEGVSITNSASSVVTMDSSGTRTVEFTTNGDTKDQKYTIRVSESTQKYDEVTVSVVKGGITLVAQGSQIYYLGEEIKLSGTNSESDTTYFFFVGPNLDSTGVKLDDVETSVDNGIESTFVSTEVNADDTFKYEWQTSQIDIDAGAYTIYAVSQPVDKSHLGSVAYGTVSVTIKKPFVSATVSQPTVAKGDKIFIEGTAEGNPSSVMIWILGKNYEKISTQTIDSDSTYKYEFGSGETANLASGQYFVVVQHPMQNAQFDIVESSDGRYVINRQLDSVNNPDGLVIFKLTGSGSLQGSDAAEALIQAISDPNVDDTYTKLNFIVEEPLIAIDPIGDRHVGDKFNLTGKTNLAVDDEILIEVYSSSFKPTQKTQSGEFSGVTGNVKVVKAENGMNTFSMDVDTSSFKIDEYIVMAQGITQEATGTTLFNIKEGASTPVATPTPIPTPTPVPTPVVTAPPTAPPTAIPTPVPTETTKAPGFGAVFALIGLGAVAFIVVRRQ